MALHQHITSVTTRPLALLLPLPLLPPILSHQTRQVEVAAAHRGRLSLLVSLLGKPLGALCSEMEGKQSDFRVGDVKYHLGERAAKML